MNAIVPHPVVRRLTPTFHAVDWTCPAGVHSDQGCFQQWGLGLTIAGRCQYRLQGIEYQSMPGDMLVIRPATEHVWRVPDDVAEGWRVAYCVFDPRPHWLSWLQFPEVVPGCSVLHLGHGALFHKARRLLETICKLYRSGSPPQDDWAMLALERLLLTLQGYGREQAADARVHQAMALLDAQFARDWTVEELARACHTSASHLSFLFQAAAATAPMQYLEQVRMRRAAAMLAFGHAPISQIARDLGYGYHAYFSRRFRRFTGQTPLEFRNAARQPPLR